MKHNCSTEALSTSNKEKTLCALFFDLPGRLRLPTMVTCLLA